LTTLSASDEKGARIVVVVPKGGADPDEQEALAKIRAQVLHFPSLLSFLFFISSLQISFRIFQELSSPQKSTLPSLS
jgi:hypothetical protein